MLELLQTKLQRYTNENDRYNFLREYLQLLILKFLDEKGYFRNLAFVGGTALRILYDLKRFSEDLDFCLVSPKNFALLSLVNNLKLRCRQENLVVDITYKNTKAVAQINLKFPKLLFALGFTSHKDKKLFIKIEIDQTPPAGFKTELTLINKEFLISINHYDTESLFASKLHALLYRKYAKGRDYYDLLWYLSRKIKPNYVLLNNAILQTQHKNLHLDQEALIALLAKQIQKVNFKNIVNDVAPFLEDQQEIRFLQKDFMLKQIMQLKVS